MGEAQWVNGRLRLLLNGEEYTTTRYLALHLPSGKLYDIQQTTSFRADRSGTRQQPVTFTISGENTGIGNQLTIDYSQLKLYDLQGRRVNGQWSIVNGQWKPGVYVSDGRKVVVK
jgi:hypothetical protein